MIQIPLTPDKYQAALSRLLNGVAAVTSFTPPDTSPGQIATPLVLLSFEYDASLELLNVIVLEKHGVAKFASEGTIKSHLMDILNAS